MKTSTVLVIVVGVLLSFASVATATGYLWSRDVRDRPAAAPTLPAIWPSKGGQALRAVPIPSGEMLTALPPDTGPHVLCQALSQQRWDALLGSKTLREVRDGACHAITATHEVTLRLAAAPAALEDPHTVDVAGLTGEAESLAPEVNARLDVRLTSAAPTPQINPFLLVEVGRTSPTAPAVTQAPDELAGSLATEVVRATMAPGPSLPTQNAAQTIAFRKQAPVPEHGIADSPWPVISWQLCTALLGELGGTAKPRFDGRCTVRGVEAVYTDDVSPRVYPDTLAGRPAMITDKLVAVKLTDDSAQEVGFSGGSDGKALRALAESVLPSLLAR
ncbi:hypothetical protein FNH05_07315 [Amycolatopsis rhizosphaerae]|uniref:Uncharacterized protein n=1 Tax=Amycolatopsis rhizosphaerae TaxID=2053003 RepID=A0A558D962_9PSEU|nr:hypothetical protein [Amycolatopsis rhizosphaerae]TVT57555.1 hypothetical protein FNH05_07315 [Amycolatopsis rhizosphaerae]